MKKLFAVISVVAFFGVLAAPVFATDNYSPVIVNEEKPKVKKAEKKAETKSDCAVPCCPAKKAACDQEKK